MFSTNLLAKEIKLLEKNIAMAGILQTSVMDTPAGYIRKIKVRIIQDVYNSDKKIIIPKWTVLHGKIKDYDFKKGEATAILETKIGNNKIIFQIGSGDNSEKLKGEVWDIQGNKILGNFVNIFSETSLNLVGLKQSDILPLSIQNAHTSISIKEIYSGDTQKQHLIFHVPAGVPVIVKAI